MSGDVSLVAGQRHGYIQTAFCNAQHTYPDEISNIFSQTFLEDVDITQVLKTHLCVFIFSCDEIEDAHLSNLLNLRTHRKLQSLMICKY